MSPTGGAPVSRPSSPVYTRHAVPPHGGARATSCPATSTVGDAKPRQGDSSDPSLGKLRKGSGLIAMLHTETEAAAVEISIETNRDASKDDDTAARRRAKLIRQLADTMINQRLSRLAKAEDSPVMQAESYNFEMFKFVENNGVLAKCKPEQWKGALSLIEQELRRALLHGFTKAEFAEANAKGSNVSFEYSPSSNA